MRTDGSFGTRATTASTQRLPSGVLDGWSPSSEHTRGPSTWDPGAELVFGTVTKPWRGLGGEPDKAVTAASFVSFAEPGFAKLAESTTVSPYGAHACILALERRVATTDEESRRLFRRYWRVTGPFIRLIRPSVMRALDRQLAHGSGAALE